MKLDEELKREGRMFFLGEENAACPEHFTDAQVPRTALAAKVLANEWERDLRNRRETAARLTKSRLLAKPRKRPVSAKSAELRRSAKSGTSR